MCPAKIIIVTLSAAKIVIQKTKVKTTNKT